MECENAPEKLTDKVQEGLLEAKRMKLSNEEKSVGMFNEDTTISGEKDGKKKESEVNKTDGKSDDMKESNAEIANHKEEKEEVEMLENNITDSQTENNV